MVAKVCGVLVGGGHDRLDLVVGEVPRCGVALDALGGVTRRRESRHDGSAQQREHTHGDQRLHEQRAALIASQPERGEPHSQRMD